MTFQKVGRNFEFGLDLFFKLQNERAVECEGELRERQEEGERERKNLSETQKQWGWRRGTRDGDP